MSGCGVVGDDIVRIINAHGFIVDDMRFMVGVYGELMRVFRIDLLIIEINRCKTPMVIGVVEIQRPMMQFWDGCQMNLWVWMFGK